MALASQPHVLVLVDGPLDRTMSGPAIRGVELAHALAASGRAVTVAARGGADRRLGPLRVVPYTRARVLRAARDAGAVVAAWLPPYVIAALARSRTLRVADLYDPLEHELGAGRVAAPASVAANLRGLAELSALQLRHADLIACATDGQRAALIDRLRAAGRATDVVVAPFGVPDRAPAPAGRRIRDRYPAIADGDVLVLWWGSLWPWFDPDAALRAVAALAPEHPELKLVVAAGVPRRQGAWAAGRMETLRDAATARGLLDQSVFLWDDWVPYDERDALVGEADAGLMLARDPAEARLAARSRLLDYVWCAVPPVLSGGEELPDRLAAAGFAATAPAGDHAAVVAALRRHVLDPAARARAAAAGERLRAGLAWPATLASLVDAITRAEGGGRDRPAAWRLAADVGAYYARVAAGRVSRSISSASRASEPSSE